MFCGWGGDSYPAKVTGRRFERRSLFFFRRFWDKMPRVERGQHATQAETRSMQRPRSRQVRSAVKSPIGLREAGRLGHSARGNICGVRTRFKGLAAMITGLRQARNGVCLGPPQAEIYIRS
jgi:hypothetical protein